MSSTATVTKPTEALTSSTPIDILQNDFAKVYTHLHPILVLALFYYQFPSLVADPVLSLTSSLAPLGILQIAYVTICLPATGAMAAPTAPLKPGQRRKAGSKSEAGTGEKIVPAFLCLVLSVILGTPLLTLSLILFGAPLTTHQLHTLLCAAHVSLLASIPLIYVHGVEAARWRDVVSLMSPVDEVFGAAVGTLVGAWLGAVPIPLDWDREWQKWPVTIVTGAYVGFVVGKIAGGYLFKGRRIEFD
ncbi:glycosylphosphatidylinositol anchor biosynthesis protein 11 [Cryomyces antarcticus]|nr:Glycosylphosphatidylinositol (GPI) anchor assembly protein [Cryomyces antarcticus]